MAIGGKAQPPERRPVFRDFLHQPSGAQGEGYLPEMQWIQFLPKYFPSKMEILSMVIFLKADN